jgi:geranylgeranyl diphosphate synthase type II
LISGPEVRRLPAELVLRVIHELSHAAGVAGLVGGQAADLESENKDVDLATVEYIHVRKTGALILAALRAGAQIAGAKTADLRKLSKFGEYLGLAFQIADDVLDNIGETLAGEGVESGRNELKKATYPSVVGIVQATERLQELLRLCNRELVSFGKKGETLTAIAEHIIARAVQDRGRTAEENIS